jgi:hypothetical protein
LDNLSKQDEEKIMKRTTITALRKEAGAGSQSGSFFGYFWFFA